VGDSLIGRTSDSGSDGWGSNPCPPVLRGEPLVSQRFFFFAVWEQMVHYSIRAVIEKGPFLTLETPFTEVKRFSQNGVLVLTVKIDLMLMIRPLILSFLVEEPRCQLPAEALTI
jgi:hypothetical protein